MREKLCTRLMADRGLNTLARRVGGDMSDDIMQEVMLAICEKTDDQLKKIEAYFNFWASRVILNTSTKHGRIGKYMRGDRNKKLSGNARAEHIDEYDHSIDMKAKEVEDILSNIYWYKRELFYTYMECGTYRKVEELTGIDHCSVYLTVKEVKNIIKNRMK